MSSQFLQQGLQFLHHSTYRIHGTVQYKIQILTDQFAEPTEKAIALVRALALISAIKTHPELSNWVENLSEGIKIHRSLIRAAAVATLDNDKEFDPSELADLATLQ